MKHGFRRSLVLFAVPSLPLVPLLLLRLLLGSGPAEAEEKPRISRQDELPRHEYQVEGPVADLVQSPAAFAPFAAQVRADIEGDIAGYEIADRATLQGLHHTLLQLDLLEGRDESALARLDILRELEEKQARRLTLGLATEARVAAWRELGPGGDDAAFKAAFRRHYAERVSGLPWDVVQDELQATKGQMQVVSENLVLGIVQAELQPTLDKAGTLSGAAAHRVVAMHAVVHLGLPIKDEVVAVLEEVIASHREEKEDIWAARSVDLDGRPGLSPVLIAVWDTGVDVDVFRDQAFVNPAEALDGSDTDGNGHVDDLHGIAYDLDWNRASGSLYPMAEATRPVGELQANLKGIFDLRAAVDSPEAAAVREKMAAMSPGEVKPFVEDSGRYAHYCHGTHVAGIALEGNPAGRVLVARLTGDPRMIPEPPTPEECRRAAESFQETVAYFKEHGVRVVNMSWVIARSSIENELEANGIGKNAEERKQMARELFDVMKDGLERAMKSAPEILFVGGAGNDDNDVTFDEFAPPMFELPNLLIAGAVDQAGDPTSFTSFGPTVNVYANGFEVESFVPGGDRMKLSGTSMAAPNVANLAAKLLALDPELTPEGVIALIQKGADERREGDQVMRMVNPKRTVALLEERIEKARL